jgi:hypothetical protein
MFPTAQMCPKYSLDVRKKLDSNMGYFFTVEIAFLNYTVFHMTLGGNRKNILTKKR